MLVPKVAYSNVKFHPFFQDRQPSDNIPKRSVKRSGLSSAAQASKHSVRFVDPPPCEADESARPQDSNSSAPPSTSVTGRVKISPDHSISKSSWSSRQNRTSSSPEPSGSRDVTKNGPPSNALSNPFDPKMTRSISMPFSNRLTRPATSFSSWQQTQTRIEMLISEAMASMERYSRGGSLQVLTQKMTDFKQGLSAELMHLDRLCDAFNCSDSSLKGLIQEERQKIAKERNGRMPQAFERLQESNPEKGFNLMSSSLEQISISTQAILDTVQLNWFDFTDSEHSRRGTHIEDYIGSLSVSDREDSVTTSLDSNDPADLAGLLHVYAAQFHSHSLLVRGTADEFLGCLKTNLNEPRSTRGYHLPTAGVLIANAKFLLRCSSQLVSLAANLSSALQNLPNSEISTSAADIEKLRSDLEIAGNAVCESLKGLIAQTKDVAGCLTSPNLGLPTTATTLASKPVVVLGPEMERLIGAVQDVVATTENLRQTVTSYPALRNSVSSVER